MRFSFPVMLALLSILLAAGGCSREFKHEVSELYGGHDQWLALGMRHYKFTYKKSCFCDGSDEELETIVCDDVARNRGLAIDDIFVAAKSAIEEGDKSLSVEINADYFYPKEIAFGDDLGADSSISVSILDFSSLSEESDECAVRE